MSHFIDFVLSPARHSVTESAKKEYFERNFAWHAISESKGDLTANIENATVMFVRPTADGKSKDRLGIMKTTYNLKVISLLPLTMNGFKLL